MMQCEIECDISATFMNNVVGLGITYAKPMTFTVPD
jgi:hypothetical protein